MMNEQAMKRFVVKAAGRTKANTRTLQLAIEDVRVKMWRDIMEIADQKFAPSFDSRFVNHWRRIIGEHIRDLHRLNKHLIRRRNEGNPHINQAGNEMSIAIKLAMETFRHFKQGQLGKMEMSMFSVDSRLRNVVFQLGID